MELSVIVPTCNRPRYLRETLLSISRQSLSQSLFEVIVVDNGEPGSALEVVRELDREIVNLRYCQEPAPGLHNARHLGMREARSELLVYVDDDIEAFPGWLAAVRDSFAERSVALVGGKNLPRFQGEPPRWLDRLWVRTPWGMALSHYSVLDLGEARKEIPPEYVWGCNFAIRKSVLAKAGGFHPDGMPKRLLRYRGDGETHVSSAVRALGLKAEYNPEAAIHHLVPAGRLTADYLYQRSFSQGISDSYTAIRRHRGLTPAVRALLFLRRAKSLLGSLSPAADGEFASIGQAMSKGYRDGISFHAGEVRKDPALLEWVLKTDYLGEPHD